jgi:hypothetical protein
MRVTTTIYDHIKLRSMDKENSVNLAPKYTDVTPNTKLNGILKQNLNYKIVHLHFNEMGRVLIPPYNCQYSLPEITMRINYHRMKNQIGKTSLNLHKLSPLLQLSS